MTIFLSKFLPLMVYPLGLAFMLMLAAFCVKPRNWSRRLALAAVLILLVAGNRWVSFSLARSLEWRYLPPESLPAHQVVVLLGGGTEPGEYPRGTAEVNGAFDRVLYAARLYHQGVADRLVLTGGRIAWLGGTASTPADEMAALLVELGVPRSAMILEDRSQNTYENAVNTRPILEQLGASQVILVTSAMHMPRSVMLFQQQGIHVIPAPADYVVTQAGWQRTMRFNWQLFVLNLVPDASDLKLTTSVLKEYLGMAVYRLRGAP